MTYYCKIFFLLLFFQINHIFINHSKIIGAAILPHGDFAFDPDLLPNKIGAKILHESCVSVAEWIMNDMKPDLIFFTTPHGLKLHNNFLIYENDIESGNAMIGDDLHDALFKSHKIHLDISTNKPLAQKLTYLLKQLGNNVEGLSSFGKHETLPLKWGEIIPIKYLENVNKNLPEFIIYSFPKIRHKYYIEQLLFNGFSLFNILDDERITGDINIMIMISADLAHTHYNKKVMPYGNCDCAQLFDDNISKWIKTMNRDFLLKDARYQQLKGAKSCGFNGFVLLQGIFDASMEEENTDWMSQLHANYHPTYYGMAVGNFTRIIT
eukprot:313728_1